MVLPLVVLTSEALRGKLASVRLGFQFGLASLLLLASCAVAPPRPAKTDLMKRLEADGAGDLSEPGVTKEALYSWLRKRPDAYNKQLQKECAGLDATAPVHWHDSVDGKICAAARSIVLAPERKRDFTTFRGGNR